ncbi:hypothetical protein BS50DRAFT_633681 [Corynespora cassiicola Philippines]|uniref:C2H2-type domain-containing protein n=1 Tax=Corynespora cassiicola Philippines TaxID=1448308 RepID=A0A2T2NRH8_CORCC|nr:hypothetical protein BS50DRAFT_633681 [Corynespora cassiicola Philippines]
MEYEQTPDDNSSSDEGTLIETPPERMMSYDGSQLQADVAFNSQASASQQYGNNFDWNGGGTMGNSWTAGPGPSMPADSLYLMGGMPTSFGGSGVADFTHSPLMPGMQLLQPPALHHSSDAHPYSASANPGQMAANPRCLDPHMQGDPASQAENPLVNLGSILSNGARGGDQYMCGNPQCSYRKFKKLADLKRHHGSVHKSWESNMYCPHWDCERGTNSKNPFTRKDKLRSHLDHKHAGQLPPSNDADF